MADLQALDELQFMQSNISLFRGERWDHQRVPWDEHCAKLEHEGSFAAEYRMTLDTHRQLNDILRDIITRDQQKSNGSAPIEPEHVIGMGLRTLGGGRVIDCRHVFGMSRAAGYACVDDFIYAVNNSPELAIRMPSTVREWEEANAGFRSKSLHELMFGAAFAIDGFFCPTNQPRQSEVNNVVAYYSGHYEMFGVNCQAGIFANLEFGQARRDRACPLLSRRQGEHPGRASSLGASSIPPPSAAQ